MSLILGLLVSFGFFLNSAKMVKRKLTLGPRLPLEMTSLILDEACRDVSSADEWSSLCLVSKQTLPIVLKNLYHEIRIRGVRGLWWFARTLKSPLRGQSVKSLSICYIPSSDRREDIFFADDLCKLLQQCPNLNSLAVKMDSTGHFWQALLSVLRGPIGSRLKIKRLKLVLAMEPSSPEGLVIASLVAELITCLSSELVELSTEGMPMIEPSGILASLAFNNRFLSPKNGLVTTGRTSIVLGSGSIITTSVLLGIPKCCPNLASVYIAENVGFKDRLDAIRIDSFTELLNPETMKRLSICTRSEGLFNGTFDASLTRLSSLKSVCLHHSAFQRSLFKHSTIYDLDSLRIRLPTTHILFDDEFDDEEPEPPQELIFEARDQLRFANNVVEELESIGFTEDQDGLPAVSKLDEIVILKRIHVTSLRRAKESLL